MATREAVALVVRTAIAEVLAVEPDEIEETTNLEVDFRIDSLELMEIGTRLESMLDVRIPVETLVRIRTVGQAVDLLRAELAATVESGMS
jgi:acyl carrier protein